MALAVSKLYLTGLLPCPCGYLASSSLEFNGCNCGHLEKDCIGSVTKIKRIKLILDPYHFWVQSLVMYKGCGCISLHSYGLNRFIVCIWIIDRGIDIAICEQDIPWLLVTVGKSFDSAHNFVGSC